MGGTKIIAADQSQQYFKKSYCTPHHNWNEETVFLSPNGFLLRCRFVRCFYSGIRQFTVRPDPSMWWKNRKSWFMQETNPASSVLWQTRLLVHLQQPLRSRRRSQRVSANVQPKSSSKATFSVAVRQNLAPVVDVAVVVGCVMNLRGRTRPCRRWIGMFTQSKRK